MPERRAHHAGDEQCGRKRLKEPARPLLACVEASQIVDGGQGAIGIDAQRRHHLRIDAIAGKAALAPGRNQVNVVRHIGASGSLGERQPCVMDVPTLEA